MCTCQLTRPPLTLAACGTPSSGEAFPSATVFVLTTQVQCCGYPEQSSCEHAANVRSNALPSCLPFFSLHLLTVGIVIERTLAALAQAGFRSLILE